MDETTAPVTVFLLDDHEIVRRGVRELIEADDGLEVVGEAGTAAEARTATIATTLVQFWAKSIGLGILHRQTSAPKVCRKWSYLTSRCDDSGHSRAIQNRHVRAKSL